MSHSYADILLNDPAHLLELLYSKYGNIDEDLEQLYINQILYNKKSHYDTLFKEYQYSDILEEFLRRFYKSAESFPRIPKLSNYYKNYYLFFCKPVFRDCRVNLIMNKYGDTKAEIFYKDNYGNDSELKNEHDQHIESSSSSSSSECFDSKNKCNNGNVNKTIFDKNTRKFIENSKRCNKHNKCNSNTNNNVKSSDSLILNVCDDSKLNQTLGLISKRSNNSSFLDLMQTLSIRVNIPMSINNSVTGSANRNCINSNNMTRIKDNMINSNKKYSKMSSLCTLTKRIAELPSNNNNNNNNNNGSNRFLISPKMKMFLNNNTVKTKFAEFKHNYNNNNNNQRKIIPNINASSNISSTNNINGINKNPSIVVPIHRKNNSYQQNSINGNTIISNFIHNHKSSRLTRNNTKRLSYNLSLKKSSIQSNPISNVNSLSNNQNTNHPNNTINHKPKASLIKSPQHSSANAYFNIVFNMTHNSKTKSSFRNKPNNTKTFYIHQSHRSNSQKENTNSSSHYNHNNTNNNNNNNHLINNRNSRNQHIFNNNPARTSTQSVKSLSKTKTICTRSVDDKETNSIILNKINTKINIINKHQQYNNIYNNMKHTTYNKQLPLFQHNKQSQLNQNQIQNIKNNNKRTNNTNAKGNIMLKILNGFNISNANKLKLIQNKSKKSKNI